MTLQQVQALTIGQPAADLLDATNGWATVHSAFARAANIRLGNTLLTVATPGIQNLPYGLLCAAGSADFYRRLRPQTRVRVTGRRLFFPEAGLQIDGSAAAVWSPRLRLPVAPATGAALRPRMATVHALALARAEATGGRGLTYLLPHLAALLAHPAMAPAALTGVRRDHFDTVAALLSAVRAAARSGQPATIVGAGERLLGLGIGLTPSGDDVLAGLLTTLIVTAPQATAVAAVAATQTLAALATRRTTAVSAGYLLQAGQGYVTERLGNLLTSIVVDGGRAPGRLNERAAKMLAHGATSGAELVLGLLLGLSIVLEETGGCACGPNIRERNTDAD
jgi:hypothetical protein